MILGFEFETNTEPFACYSLVNSLVTSGAIFVASEVTK